MILRWNMVGAVVAGVALGMFASVALAEELEEKAVVKGGVSIRLPKTWKVEERGDGRGAMLVARAAERDKDAEGEFRTLLTISSEAANEIDAAKQQAQVAKELSNYKAVEKPEAITINGLEGVKFGGTMTTGSVKLRSRQFLLLHEKRLYTLTFMSLASVWKAYEPIIEASAATFNIPAK